MTTGARGEDDLALLSIPQTKALLRGCTCTFTDLTPCSFKSYGSSLPSAGYRRTSTHSEPLLPVDTENVTLVCQLSVKP